MRNAHVVDGFYFHIRRSRWKEIPPNLLIDLSNADSAAMTIPTPGCSSLMRQPHCLLYATSLLISIFHLPFHTRLVHL